jgi:hypothetical protein
MVRGRGENLKSLHLGNLEQPDLTAPGEVKHAATRDDPWEAAYLAFETPEQEIRKFVRRLIELGAQQ